MLMKLNLCQQCAAKLRAVRDRDGEEAMARAIGEVLCQECRRQIPAPPGARIVTLSKKESNCPFCGLVVVRDDATMTLSHQLPECDDFRKLVAQFNPAETKVTGDI
jgi:hypothetical protein